MKRLIISNDCDGSTIDSMLQAQDVFSSYGIPFSESCWVYAKNGVSLLDYDISIRGISTEQSCYYDSLRNLIKDGRIDTLHTWGDFPTGDFDRALAVDAMELLDEDIRFKAWTAHGGYNDLQNLSPLGLGDSEGSTQYHMDITKKLGIKYYNLNTDIDVQQINTAPINYGRFRRFRGLSKEQAYSINIEYLPEQIRMINMIDIHNSVDLVILYTHLYATERPDSKERWEAVETFKLSDRVDKCLRDLLDREDFVFTTLNEVLI